jgi:hypothetical protein
MSISKGTCGALATAALATVGLAAQALADDYFSPTDERVRLSLGAMYVSSSTNIQADSSAGVTGTNFNAENEFGLSKTDFEPKFQAMVRVDTRQRLSFDYFTLDRSGDRSLTSGPLIFRDVVFQPGDPLQTQLSLRTLGITYGYSFWHSPTVEIAATFGIHETDISALAKVETQTRHIIQTDDQAGPVPTVGIDATWVASRRFYLDARVQYLDVHVHDLSGSLGIFELDVLYRYRANVAFGLGYTDLRARLASTQTAQSGLFDFSTQGPEMFFRISF